MGDARTYTSTTDWDGPTAFLAILLVALALVLWLGHAGWEAHRRGMERLRRAEAAERAARADGHPAGLDRVRLTVDERRRVARELAGLLVDSGFRLQRSLLDTDLVVMAWGMDGVYTAYVGPDTVLVGYRTNHGTETLGRCHGTHRAASTIMRHAGLASAA